MPDVDGYIRVSTGEQAQEGVSLDSQRAKIVGYCQLYELTLCEVIGDAGESGGSIDRPGLARVMERFDAGVTSGVVITKLDRLTRSLGDWSFLIDRYFGEKGKKRLYSVSDSINTATANGRMMINLLMTIAQWEREIIAERTKDALRHKIAKGERVGKVRFGYDLGPDGRVLVVNPTELETIRLMHRMRQEGLSLRAIASMLQELGIETKEGKQLWTPATIDKIIKRAS